jgi:hypothetical protein
VQNLPYLLVQISKICHSLRKYWHSHNVGPPDREKAKRKDLYIVNDSNASKKSHRSAAASNKSENYDPIPRAKVKQMQLMKPRPNSNPSEDSRTEPGNRSFRPGKDSWWQFKFST